MTAAGPRGLARWRNVDESAMTALNGKNLYQRCLDNVIVSSVTVDLPRHGIIRCD